MGQIALSIAAADGVISGREVAALERLYTALGLETGGIYSALHSLTSADDPVTVMPPAEAQPGFAIPPSPDSEGALSLDAEKGRSRDDQHRAVSTPCLARSSMTRSRRRNPPKTMAKVIVSSVVWTKSTRPFLVS